MLTSILIALSLNFDTFSVAVIEGAQTNNPTSRQSLRVGLFFGIGQALMALMGTLLGLGFKTIIINIDHWIAFLLLCFVGGKMIYDSKNKKGDNKRTDLLDNKSLLLLAIATSIDALIIGITFAFLNQSILFDIFIIGVISFVASFTGFHSGEKLRLIFRNKIKIIGGIMLILIGIKILIEHILIK